MTGETHDLAALLAAWRADIDSAPAPAMVVLEAALALYEVDQALSPRRWASAARFLARLRARRASGSSLHVAPR